MKIPVFLSYPNPHMKMQVVFIEKLKAHLKANGFEPRTLGVSAYDTGSPLMGIRRIMNESDGVLVVALHRSYIKEGISKPGADISGQEESGLNGKWLTSSFCQIEPAMAFQMGLPVLVLREKGVIEDGIMEKGVLGAYMPEFDLEGDVDNYFNSEQFRQLMQQWEFFARQVARNKAQPPKLYG